MNSDVTYDRLQFSFPDVAVKAFRDCGYEISEVRDNATDEERTKILDDFIVSLFGKLDFPQSVIDDRRTIVKDSYPSI